MPPCVNASTGNQTTTYEFGSTLANSDIASSLLKIAEIYPDSIGGSDQKTFTYNRQSEIVTATDQNGTVHVFDFDKLGRETHDRVTVLGAGVDGAVRRISTTFEVRGMRGTITSFDNPSVGAGNLVNQVQFAYNDFGQLTHDFQSHAGAVDAMTTPKVQYLYASGADNTTRPTAIVHPNGRVVAYGYGEPGSLDDCASRIKTITDGGPPEGTSSSSSSEQQTLVEYVYLGHDTFIEIDYTEPQIKYTLIGTEGGDDPDTGDIYRGLDRFGRIKDNYWYNYNSSTDVDRIKYGYDRAGNRTYRQNTVAETEGKHFDEKYLYDALDRLKSLDRGTLNELKTAIVDSTFGQCWTLDETGNWHGFRQDDDGDGNWNLIQQRIANKVNEITDIDNTTGPTWVTPAYDPAGNMTTIPQPADPSKSYTATYDAWNRLTKIEDDTTSNTVATYLYDGAKRRIIQHNYEEGIIDETRHLYYTQPSQWQVIEERINSSTEADRQFIWGRRYIDDLILRDREEERLYALQDANWNVTAIADATGSVQERYAYTAYGVPLFLDADFTPRIASLFNWETLFCSYRWDTQIDCHQVRRRLYWQNIGVWSQRDPIGYVEGMNLFVYAFSSPVSYHDPFGLRVWTGQDPDTICCKRVQKYWEYWQYQSSTECQAHVLLMISLRPGGALTGVGAVGLVFVRKALSVGNYASIIAGVALPPLTKWAAKKGCEQELCLKQDIVPVKCELYSYPVFWGLYECYRVNCQCPLGSTPWGTEDDPKYPPRVPWEGGAPNWNLDELIEEAKDDWPE